MRHALLEDVEDLDGRIELLHHLCDDVAVGNGDDRARHKGRRSVRGLQVRNSMQRGASLVLDDLPQRLFRFAGEGLFA